MNTSKIHVKPNDLKITAIIQARVESTRLPAKILFPINNKPILQLLIDRISLTKYIDHIVIACPNSNYSELIYYELKKDPNKHPHISFFKGSQDDVFDRVLKAALETHTDIIVDITSDCPFIDPNHLDYHIYILICSLLTFDPIDYVSNVVTRTWPDGFDLQVYTLKAFKKLNEIISNTSYRQHTGWNFIGRKSFKVFGTKAPDEYCYPKLAVTLDTLEDYLLISKIYKHFDYDISISAEEIIKFLIGSPELQKINSEIKRKNPGEK